MELHRSRSLLVAALIFGVGGVLVLVSAGDRVSVVRWFFGGLGLLLCLGFLIRELRPFRFVISAEGLNLRVPGINRLVGWDEIGALTLVQPPRTGNRLPSPRLLLAPAPGSDLRIRLTEKLPDGSPARPLLECDDVKEPADEIAAALARLGGGRFTDARSLEPSGPSAGGSAAAADLTIVLRGYDRGQVDAHLSRLAAMLG